MLYTEMTKEQLLDEKKVLEERYNAFKAKKPTVHIVVFQSIFPKVIVSDSGYITTKNADELGSSILLTSG